MACNCEFGQPLFFHFVVDDDIKYFLGGCLGDNIKFFFGLMLLFSCTQNNHFLPGNHKHLTPSG